METISNNHTPLKGEILRKTIHYSSALISVIYYFIEKNIAVTILSVILVTLLLVEFIKYENDSFFHFYMKYFKHMLREHEYDKRTFRINGATWVVLSCLICIIFFPKLIAIMGMLFLSFADSSAGIVGRLFGRKQYAPNRSYVGTVTFFIAGMLVIAFTPKYFYSSTEYLLCSAAVIITTFAEAFNLHIDDNFTIPVVGSLSLYILYSIFLGISYF